MRPTIKRILAILLVLFISSFACAETTFETLEPLPTITPTIEGASTSDWITVYQQFPEVRGRKG